jgi:type VI secretion system secreted protein Hcp
MAFDAFLRIEGIPGESSDKDFPNWIEILSLSHGVAQPDRARVAREAGKATGARGRWEELTITKPFDSSSLLLASACGDGTYLKEAEIKLHRAEADGKRLCYLHYKLRDVLISGYSTGGGGGVPTDTVRLDFADAQVKYFRQARTGGGGSLGFIEVSFKPHQASG